MTDEAGEERGQGGQGGQGGRAETGETGRGGNQQRRVYVKRGAAGTTAFRHSVPGAAQPHVRLSWWKNTRAALCFQLP